MSDEDAPCDICRSKESEPSNEMVFCDICDVCVHQACYGVTEIPKGPWFCKPCEENIRPKCIFCHNTKGAKKKTKNGNWAHVSCALWIPEVSFGDPEKMDNIVNIEKIPKSRWSLTCSLCHERGGACIQCYVKKCKTAYHVTCAFEFNLHMEMEDVEESDQEIKFESFCLTHTSLYATGQNPHESKKRKKTQENLESKENQIISQPLQTKASVEDENRPSTSQDSGNPVVSVAEKTIEKSGSEIKNGDDTSRIGAGLFTEEDIVNIAAFSKGTARKSFALQPKKIHTLSQVLPRPNPKKPRNVKRPLPDKSKQASEQNGPSNPKKPRSKQPSKKKIKALIHPIPTQFATHEEEKNTTQSEQTPQFSRTPTKQSFSNSSDSAGDIRTLFPAPNRQTMINDMPSTSNAQQFLPSSVKQTPSRNGQPLSDNFDDFSRYMTSLLRTLPFKKALRVQKKIISLVLKEHDLSSGEEFVSSCSSEE